MKIALATPPYPASVNDGLYQVEKLSREAAAAQAEIVCFPETYIPGYPLGESETVKASAGQLKDALHAACETARKYNIAVILPMDWPGPDGLLNSAAVISSQGEVMGFQTKNQLDPSEDNLWVPGKKRTVFTVGGLKFGISICHEGWRYPETVRWAARNGAHIIFHPHFAGSDVQGVQLTEWGHKDNPYYEKAMIMRAKESTVYFASVGYAMRYQEAATTFIAPDGAYLAHEAYGAAGVLVYDIDLKLATGYLAKRFKPELY